ncbi:MAG: hypothetical protein F9B45_02255 [Phycisphaera sp. RhM]|nr:hypothetical protein [Phycisphaera sp. RhM]
MNSDQHHQDCQGRDFCGRGIVFWLGMWLLAIAALQHPAVAEDRSQGSEAVDRTTDDGRDEMRANKRGRRKRHAKRLQLSPTSPAKTPIRLQLDGSFELDLGFGNAIRGKGNISIELDRATAERLGADALGQLDESASVASDLVQTLKTVPEMVQQTAEILKLLSNPETQQNLRQVEQVLRLFSQAGSLRHVLTSPATQ